jgi:hypothetical protein
MKCRRRLNMNKCPACGYTPLSKGQNISLKIRNLMIEREKKTIQSLNKIAKLIIDNVPQDDRMSYYKFLYGIKNCKDDVVRHCIETYYKTRAFQSNKGFAYLRAKGNAIKYLCRHKQKGQRKDLEKAKHYIDMAIERDYS